jgi:hypothetical protein
LILPLQTLFLPKEKTRETLEVYVALLFFGGYMEEYGRIDVHRLTSKRLKLESKLAFINQL